MNRILAFIFTLMASTIAGTAQKLPSVQTESLRPPDRVVIDGRFKEWGDHPRAHNNATELSYTIANDDEKLYLVVQAVDEDVVTKIVRGGLTLIIQKTGKKDDKNSVAVTYPISDYTGLFHLKTTSDTSAQAVSALLERYNKMLEQHIKSIRVSGIEGVDTLISIYNENNIKAAGLFDSKKVYTIEMSVPLKYLQLSADTEPKFAYHIVLNGYKRTSTFRQTTKADGTPLTGPEIDRIVAAVAKIDAVTSAKTDFWGEYTLAKK